MNEAETRAEHIDPALQAAGWGIIEGSRIRREHAITLGRIEGHGRRGKPLTADYVLVYRNTKLAVIEAKARGRRRTTPGARLISYPLRQQPGPVGLPSDLSPFFGSERSATALARPSATIKMHSRGDAEAQTRARSNLFQTEILPVGLSAGTKSTLHAEEIAARKRAGGNSRRQAGLRRFRGREGGFRGPCGSVWRAGPAGRGILDLCIRNFRLTRGGRELMMDTERTGCGRAALRKAHRSALRGRRRPF